MGRGWSGEEFLRFSMEWSLGWRGVLRIQEWVEFRCRKGFLGSGMSILR